MAYTERKAIFEDIEKIRKRPLICYFTNARPGANAIIASDAIREFVAQIEKLPKGTTEIDLIINSTGGDGLTSWRLISMIREKIGPKGKLNALVPHFAFSAATLICLGADEIYMHPLSCLGPIDPQITVTTKDGNVRFAYEDLVAFADFLNDEGKITGQSERSTLLDSLVKEIRPSVLGASKRSSGQSITMAKRLLKMHMKGKQSAARADVIAEKLNKSYFSHGHAVSKTEAVELGLKIAKGNDKLDELLWKIYEDIEVEAKMREPFIPLAICLSDPANAFLMAPPPVVAVPQNLPPQLLQQFWANYLTTNIATQQCQAMDYELIPVMIESPRHNSRFSVKGKIFAARKADMDYTVAAPQTSARWE